MWHVRGLVLLQRVPDQHEDDGVRGALRLGGDATRLEPAPTPGLREHVSRVVPQRTLSTRSCPLQQQVLALRRRRRKRRLVLAQAGLYSYITIYYSI